MVLPDSATFIQVVFNLVLWVILFALMKPACAFPYSLNVQRRSIAIIGILLFCLFPYFGGDYFNYNEIFVYLKVGRDVSIEEVYKLIIKNCGYSYTFFRLIIWGVAVFFTLTAYKRLEVSFDLALFFFVAFYLPWFSYARVSLAMALIIFGLSLISRPIKRKKVLSVILGLLFIGCAEYFHRSAVIGITAALGSLFLINANKRIVLIVGVFFVFMIIALRYLIIYFLSLDLSYDTFISGEQRNYYLLDSNAGSGVEGIGASIMNILTRLPLILVAFLYIIVVYKGFYRSLPISVRVISSYSFILIMIALGFSYNLGFNTYVLYYRTLNFAMIPSAVFLASLKENHIKSELFKIIYYLSLIGIVYTLVYTIYCTIA